jgi:hypothetical protein
MKFAGCKTRFSQVKAFVVLLLWAALPACIGFGSVTDDNLYAVAGAGQSFGDGTDESTDPDGSNDSNDTTSPDNGGNGSTSPSGDCSDIPFGRSCQEGSLIYNVSFEGIEVASMEEGELSLIDVHCAGFNSAILFSGDTS